VVHHVVALLLIKGSLVGLRSKITIIDVLFETILLRCEVCPLVTVLGAQALRLICVAGSILLF